MPNRQTFSAITVSASPGTRDVGVSRPAVSSVVRAHSICFGASARAPRHQQVHRQAAEQRTAGHHLHASAGHDSTVEGDHHATRFAEAFGDRQYRIAQGAHDTLDVAAEVPLGGSGRFTAASEHEQAHTGLLFHKRRLQFSVALAYISGGNTRRQGAFPKGIEKASALLARGPAALLILQRQPGEQIRLGVDANRATVIGAAGHFRLPIEDVQELQRRLHAACRPGCVVGNELRETGLIDASQDLVLDIHQVAPVSGPSTARWHPPCRGRRTDPPSSHWPRSIR
jgi:hypothetical protein